MGLSGDLVAILWSWSPYALESSFQDGAKPGIIFLSGEAIGGMPYSQLSQLATGSEVALVTAGLPSAKRFVTIIQGEVVVRPGEEGLSLMQNGPESY